MNCESDPPQKEPTHAKRTELSGCQQQQRQSSERRGAVKPENCLCQCDSTTIFLFPQSAIMCADKSYWEESWPLHCSVVGWDSWAATTFTNPRWGITLVIKIMQSLMPSPINKRSWFHPGTVIHPNRSLSTRSTIHGMPVWRRFGHAKKRYWGNGCHGTTNLLILQIKYY